MAAGLAALLAWAIGSGPIAPVAALSAPGSSTTSTTSTSEPVTSSTTTTALPTTTTTLAGVPDPGETGSSTTTTTTASGPGSGTDGGGPTTSTTAGSGPTTTVPPTPAMAAEQASVRRSGPSSTAPLLAALAPLARLGLSPEQIAILGFGQFPVAGPATYSDIFLEYRSWPEPHVHQGIDISAPEGTPLRSPADGTLTYSDSDPNGYGLTALVTQSDGTVYLLAHMSATVLGLSSGAKVTQGQVIGFVGETGDSTGPHLDFEIHPHGGPAIDAKPILDEYVAAAIAAAPGLIARYEGAGAAGGPATEVSVPSAAPENLYVRSPRDAGGEGRPIAMVSTSGGRTTRLLIAGGSVLTLAAVGWAAWRSRRRDRKGWVGP